ncbi:MAG: hypothetical protein PHF88_02030 [Candidatus Pacebacteria bacterium]|nr:hypothetical protein [Candidatus Paceibacterota bacterium]
MYEAKSLKTEFVVLESTILQDIESVKRVYGCYLSMFLGELEKISSELSLPLKQHNVFSNNEAWQVIEKIVPLMKEISSLSEEIKTALSSESESIVVSDNSVDFLKTLFQKENDRCSESRKEFAVLVSSIESRADEIKKTVFKASVTYNSRVKEAERFLKEVKSLQKMSKLK